MNFIGKMAIIVCVLLAYMVGMQVGRESVNWVGWLWAVVVSGTATLMIVGYFDRNGGPKL